jgi:hypothetical protein
VLTLVAILTTLAAGLLPALAVDHRARGPALLGASFLYGSAIVALSQLALAAAGLPFTLTAVTLGLLIPSALCLPRLRRLPPMAPEGPASRFHPLDAATGFLVGCFAFYATLAPPWEWDFWAIWGLKARVFLGAGTIDWRFLESRFNDYAHPDYPLLLPLNYLYAGLVGGGWDDRWLGLYSVAFGLALLLVVRQHAGAELRPWAAAAVAFGVAFFAFGGLIVGLAEGPLVAFATASLLAVRRAVHKDADPRLLRHGALLLGGAALCKNEGATWLLAVGIALVLTRPRLLPRLWPAAAVAAPWWLLASRHTLSNDLVRGAPLARALERLESPAAFLRILADALPDRPSWLMMLAALVVVGRGALRRERFALLAVLAQLAAFLAAYLVTPLDLGWHVAHSWPRLSRQLAAPLACVILIALARSFGAQQPKDEAAPSSRAG